MSVFRALRQAYRAGRAAGMPDEIIHGYLRFGPEGMTQQARMARAGDMVGTDFDLLGRSPPPVRYHGNSHGTGMIGRVDDRPFYSADRDVALTYAGDAGNLTPLVLLPAPREAAVDAGGRAWNRLEPALGAQADDGAPITTDAIAAAARGQGVQRVRFSNIRDRHYWDPDAPPHAVDVTLDPSLVRRLDATFDPRRRHWPNLLAGGAVVAPTAGVLRALAEAYEDDGA